MDEIEQLIEQLNDADMDVRWKAMLGADQIYDPRFVGPLIDRLSDPEPGVRAKAAQVLRQKYDQRIVPGLLSLLHDRDAEVRAGACYGLGGRYHREALEALLECLQDDEEEVRAAAVEALGPYASRRALQALLKVRRDDSELVRHAAAGAMSYFRVPEVVEPLIKMARRDEAVKVRLKAIECLQYVVQPLDEKARKKIDPDEDAVRQLVHLLNDEDERVAMEAARSLGAIGDRYAVSALVTILCSWDQELGRRLWAASALGRLGDRRVVPILIATLQDPVPGIRPAAARALGRLNDPQALPVLDRVAADDRGELGQAAASAADRIRYELSWNDFDQVVQYLAEGDYEERRRALHHLARFNTPRAQVLILQTLGDAVDQNDAVLFATAAYLIANKGDARALSMLARGAEYWQMRNVRDAVEEAESAAHYIRRKLQGEELEPYRSVMFAEHDAGHGLDDEDEHKDQGSGVRDQGSGSGER